VAGNLDANIFAETIKRPVTISGAVLSGRTIQTNQDIKAEAPVTIGGAGLQGKIIVGTSLAGAVTVPSSGLVGPIIVNATGDSGTWTGAVTVGSTTLGRNYYTNTSASLGGGAVGLAPFHLHDTDCVPANGATVSAIADDEITLHFYGPVTYSAGHVPVMVEYTPLVDGVAPENATWADINDDFTFAVSSTNPRELRIIADTFSDYARGSGYRVTPQRWLKCAAVTGTPQVVDFTYTVLVNP
jgi:hypothetical protein